MNSHTPAATETGFDVHAIRAQFPILEERVHGRSLVYLDNAATNQKPALVIDALEAYYRTINANVHRGVHTLSNLATDAQEKAREGVRAHIHARHAHEVIFTQGTTAALNLAAASLGQLLLNKGDEVLVTAMEHHANIVPWQWACTRQEASLKVIPINDKGELEAGWKELINERTRIVAVTHVSNTMGTINPVKQLVQEAKRHGAIVVIDGAQAVAHLPIDVQELGCDIYVFSGHKMYGPTGIGVLYGREELLERMEPWQGGGEMIDQVTFEKTTYAKLPFKFEAGTPHIAGIIGLGKAIQWMNDQGVQAMHDHELCLLEHATHELVAIDGLRIIGTANEKGPVISFVVEGVHHYDLGTLLDQQGIAVRTGHHCTQPLMERYGISGTTRASFAAYNTIEEIDRMMEAVHKAVNMLR